MAANIASNADSNRPANVPSDSSSRWASSLDQQTWEWVMKQAGAVWIGGIEPFVALFIKVTVEVARSFGMTSRFVALLRSGAAPNIA